MVRMAASGPKRQKKSADQRTTQAAVQKLQNLPLPTRPGKALTKLEAVILQLYGRGLSTGQIANLVAPHCYPEYRHNRSLMMRLTRSKLRRMESTQWFRDALYEAAVVKTDLAIPQILEGVVKKAKRGRVDAAKLALSVSGRQVDSEGQVNVPISISFGGEVPRPYGQQAIAGPDQAEDVEDAEFEEMDDEA
jgi:hypothetical protein